MIIALIYVVDTNVLFNLLKEVDVIFKIFLNPKMIHGFLLCDLAQKILKTLRETSLY